MGTFLAAFHGHKQACIMRQGLREELRVSSGKIMAHFTHYLQHLGVNPRCWSRPGRDGAGFFGIGELDKKAAAICDRPAL